MSAAKKSGVRAKASSKRAPSKRALAEAERGKEREARARFEEGMRVAALELLAAVPALLAPKSVSVPAHRRLWEDAVLAALRAGRTSGQAIAAANDVIIEAHRVWCKLEGSEALLAALGDAFADAPKSSGAPS